MVKKYYDSYEFQKVVSIVDSDPINANLLLKEYLEKYPDDYYAYTYYAGTFITLGEYDEAEKILKYIDKRFNGDAKINNNDEKVSNYTTSLIYNKLRLLAYKGQYKQLYSLCMKYFNKIKDMELHQVIFYVKNKMGVLKYGREETKGYLYRQIMEYSEEEFIEHLQRHLADYNKDLDERNSNIFCVGFPIDEVLKEVKKYIPSSKALHYGFIEDTYVFKFDECGKENKKLVNYFKVICLRGTSEIITMCPAYNCERLPCVDLNHLRKETVQEVKIMSQREKFNKRYGLK